LGRHDESRIKRIIVGERPSTAIRVISEHVVGMGGRPAEERISENSAVNPGDLIDRFFNVIRRRLGKVHGVIDRRRYPIEAFLAWWLRGRNADSRRVAYVWIVVKEPVVSVIWRAILTNVGGTDAKGWWIIGSRLDVKSRYKLGRGLEIL